MTDLFAGQPPTLSEMLSEVVREIGMRENVYPRLVASKRMTQSQADRHLMVMRAVADKLGGLGE